MTSEEKLRALLAEAQEALDGMVKARSLLFDDMNEPERAARLCSARINAALAEPTQTEAEKLLAQLGKLGKCESGRKGHSSDCGCAPCREGFRLLDKFNTARAMGEVNAMTALEKAQAEVARQAQRIATLENALAKISLTEYESTSSASEKVHDHAHIARKALYGEKTEASRD